MSKIEHVQVTNRWYDSKSRNSYEEGIAIDTDGNTFKVRRSQFNDSWYYGESSWSKWEVVNV